MRDPSEVIAALAQEIRRVDGDHSLGAAALAEALAPFVAAAIAEAAEDLRADAMRLVEKWEKNAEVHGVRTFTGNDHLLFANELRAALSTVAPVREG